MPIKKQHHKIIIKKDYWAMVKGAHRRKKHFMATLRDKNEDEIVCHQIAYKKGVETFVLKIGSNKIVY